MLELPNFGCMTISTIQFDSHDNMLLLTSWAEVMTSQPLFKSISFADIIKIVAMFVKTIYKDPPNLVISGEKTPMPAELKECFTRFIYFLDLL